MLSLHSASLVKYDVLSLHSAASASVTRCVTCESITLTSDGNTATERRQVHSTRVQARTATPPRAQQPAAGSQRQSVSPLSKSRRARAEEKWLGRFAGRQRRLWNDALSDSCPHGRSGENTSIETSFLPSHSLSLSLSPPVAVAFVAAIKENKRGKPQKSYHRTS